MGGRLFFPEEEEVDEARPLRAESAMSIRVNISKSSKILICVQFDKESLNDIKSCDGFMRFVLVVFM